MTFRSDVWSVDGNQTDAVLARLMNRAASLGGQGCIGHLDCRVTATSPTTSGIVIAPGGVVVLGQESPYQGSYTGWNVGNDTTLSIAATGGTPRSDMVIVRAEDPTWSGSPWTGPPSGQIIWPRIWADCGSSATQPMSGWSAIPLARIDMPATTSVVQQSFITDLRSVATPQRILQTQAVAGPSGSPHTWNTGNIGANWPPGANWPIYVPVWATNMVFSWIISDALWQNTGNGWARGDIWLVVGSAVTSPTFFTSQTLVSVPLATGPYRHTLTGSGSVAVPAAARGTNTTLWFAQNNDLTNTGTMAADEGTNTWAMYEFQQLAAAS